MTTMHSYLPNQLKVQLFADLPVGSIVHLPGSGIQHLCVKLDSEGSGSALLTLDEKLNVRQWPASARTVRALPLPPGELRVAIEKVGEREMQFQPGSIVLSPTAGAVLVAGMRDAHGFGEECYISMESWTFIGMPGDSWSMGQAKLMWYPLAAKEEPIVIWPPATPEA